MVPLKVLFVSPEVEPFVKVGGLADMVGSLPKALAALGHDVRVILPAYGSLRLDSAYAPADHAKAINHRRVRIRSHQRIRIQNAVFLPNHFRQIL